MTLRLGGARCVLLWFVRIFVSTAGITSLMISKLNSCVYMMFLFTWC